MFLHAKYCELSDTETQKWPLLIGLLNVRHLFYYGVRQDGLVLTWNTTDITPHVLCDPCCVDNYFVLGVPNNTFSYRHTSIQESDTLFLYAS